MKRWKMADFDCFFEIQKISKLLIFCNSPKMISIRVNNFVSFYDKNISLPDLLDRVLKPANFEREKAEN